MFGVKVGKNEDGVDVGDGCIVGVGMGAGVSVCIGVKVRGGVGKEEGEVVCC